MLHGSNDLKSVHGLQAHFSAGGTYSLDNLTSKSLVFVGVGVPKTAIMPHMIETGMRARSGLLLRLSTGFCFESSR